MNQTKKRLSIINLAISITDIETIQLQILKLALIKTDTKIQHILSVLQAENYAQAQGLITAYIDAPSEEVLQRTSQINTSIISDEDQAIIDEFDLFVTNSSSQSASKPAKIDINDYDSVRPVFKKSKHTIDFDTLLKLDPDDVLSDNIEIDISKPSKPDTFFDVEEEREEGIEIATQYVPKDTFFDAEDEEIHKKIQTQHAIIEPPKADKKTPTQEILKDAPAEEELKELTVEQEKIPSSYPAMVHIAQKLIRMNRQYPPIQRSQEKFDVVESFLQKISEEKYTESEIEEILAFIKQLITKERYAEAAQLLLICGATESKFAQFSLARELFTGSILRKNIPEAFTLMHTLSLDDYPEALCDMGQFYEHGIGTSKDTMKAESLYKEALNLGIKRAEKHYIRLKKQNRKFFK